MQYAQSLPVTISRKVSRDQRRQQIIDATIRVLARKGYAQTMISDVAKEAGVSHGLVMFHFKSKEDLLSATLLFLSDEYARNWQQALETAGPDPAQQLHALLLADFDKAICTPERLGSWTSFWGEIQGRPLYQQECAPNDKRYIAKLQEICARLNVAGNYGHDPVRTARILRMTSDGLWFDLLMMKSPYSRKEAVRSLLFCAAAFFPRHFTDEGVIA